MRKSSKIFRKLVPLLVFSFFPLLAFAQVTIGITASDRGLIPCDRACGFAEFVGLINTLIQFAFILMVAVAAVVFAYAGAKYIFSATQEGERRDANEMMWKVVVGFIWALIAWLVVTFILKSLFEPGYYKAFFNI